MTQFTQAVPGRKVGMVAMVQGIVQNGVIVLDGGVRFPAGQEVTVLAPSTGSAANQVQGGHSVLDIPTVSVGAILLPLTADDLLAEMLEDRQ